MEKNTVYDCFLRLSAPKLTGQSLECQTRVYSGIRSFLEEMDLLCTDDPSGKISKREFFRFQLMPNETFVTYFEFYQICSQIAQLHKECELLAINRLKNNSTISEKIKHQKINAFYELATVVAGDRRYASWIDDMLYVIKLELSFAAGQTNAISKDLAEWLKTN